MPLNLTAAVGRSLRSLPLASAAERRYVDPGVAVLRLPRREPHRALGAYRQPGAALALEPPARARVAGAVTGSPRLSRLPPIPIALSFLATGSLLHAALHRAKARRNPRPGECEPVVPF
jgi:hypothetical protein